MAVGARSDCTTTALAVGYHEQGVLCRLQDLPINSSYLGRNYTECEQWRSEVLSRLEKERPRLIVLDMGRRYGADFGSVNAMECSSERSIAVNANGIAGEAAAAATGGGQYADLSSLFYTAARCPAIVGNTLVYRDDNHVTIEYAQVLDQVLAELLNGALASGAPGRLLQQSLPPHQHRRGAHTLTLNRYRM